MSLFDRLQERASRRASTLPQNKEHTTLSEKLRIGRRDVPPDVAEVLRVTGLPVHDPMMAFSQEPFNREVLQAEVFNTGWRLFPIQAAAVQAYRDTGGLFAPIGVGQGKCVLANTEIFDAIKGRCRVEEIDDDLLVASKDDVGKITFERATAFPSGEKDCVQLTLRSGQSVGLSLDHPVFTARGWVKAGELKYDDLVAAPRSMPNPAPLEGIPDEEVELVAFLMADGCVSNEAVRFVDDNELVLARFEQAASACGATTSRRSEHSKATRINCKNLLPLTRKWGIQGFKSVDKRLPASWYRLPDSQVALFLNRFWACDGHVSKDALECTLGSKGLVRDLKFLLCRLGILARSSYKEAKCGGKTFDAWRLQVGGVEVEKFLKVVGVPLGQDERCSRLDFSKKRNTNTDKVPIGRTEVREMAIELGVPKSALRDRLGATQGQYISRPAFSAWAEETGYAGKHYWLATNDLSWERIKSLEPLGTRPVYDLSVPTTHNFIGNGIVLHNTLITILIADHAYKKLGIRRSVIFVPPQVYDQLIKRDIPWARKRVALGIRFHEMAGKSQAQRAKVVEKGLFGCYVFPYSLLSTTDSVYLLECLEPGLIIADEAHLLKNRTSARTKRVLNYIRDHNPQLVCLSGTITSKGINDYSHLIRYCLGENCPLPRSPVMCQEWGAVIDSTENAPSSAQIQVMLPLLEWARSLGQKDKFPATQAGLRRAYRMRLTTCPGVVATSDASIGTSLVFQNLPVDKPESCPGFQDLEKLIQKVQDEFLTPNGDEIEHAIHTYKWCYELSSGFYNELVWPDPEALAARDGLPLSEAQSRLERAKEHHQASQEYARGLRDFLHDPPKGLDTPMLVGAEIARGGPRVGMFLSDLWHHMKGLDFEGRPERDSRVVRVCDFKIRHAVKWAQSLKGEGGILWVHHQEMGRWVLEALESAGLPALECAAGQAGNTRICDPKNADKLCVASMPAHGLGKNLQHFKNQLFIQWPRPAKDAEQIVGRTHRKGQNADELLVHTCHTLPWEHVLYAATLSDATYIQQTTGMRQKLIFGTHTPMPRIYSQEFLREKGFQPKPLNPEQIKFFEERFGVDIGQAQG